MNSRHKGTDTCVECGAPANHRLVCPEHEAMYANDNRAVAAFSDDVDPASREPVEVGCG